jgi:hypothetical protein
MVALVVPHRGLPLPVNRGVRLQLQVAVGRQVDPQVRVLRVCSRRKALLQRRVLLPVGRTSLE